MEETEVMKTRTVLITGGVSLAVVLIAFGFLFYQIEQGSKKYDLLQEQYKISQKNITDSLQRADTKRAESTRDLKVFSDQIGLDLSDVDRDLRKIGSEIQAVSTTEVRTTKIIHINSGSDSSTPSNVEVPECPNDGRPIDVHGYTKRVESKRLKNSAGLTVADVSFEAANKAAWNTSVYGINYRINSVIGRTKSGQVTLHTELLATNPEVEPEKAYRIDGVDSRVLQAPAPSPEFSFWDPAVYLLGNAAVGVSPEISFSLSIGFGFSIFSYGDNWRFLGITAGFDAYQQEFRASLIPVFFNIGGPLPFFDDLFLYLDVGVSHEADISIGFGISTRL